MNRLAPLMSSASGEWQTPPEVLELVRRVGPIALDPATTIDNPTQATIIAVAPGTPVDSAIDPAVHVDGLAPKFNWSRHATDGLIFCNPPYGLAIGNWAERCAVTGDDGVDVIALVPARTDTAWWQHFCAVGDGAQAVCFWRGRLTFVGAPAPAPFPSALVYHGPNKYRFANAFAPRGAIWI